MNIFDLCVNGALFLCSGIAFVYGVVKFFKKNVAMFNQLITCGLGCMMLGRLFNIVALLTNNSIPDGFSVGKLGLIGGFMFLFSASFGQMDGLVDGGEREFRKYRLISILASVVIALLYLPVLFSTAGLEAKIVLAVIFLFLAQSAYFNLKHLIIPDVEMGFIGAIKGYNLAALILTVLSAAEVIVGNYNERIISAVFTALLCLSYLVVVPVLEKGAKQWTI